MIDVRLDQWEREWTIPGNGAGNKWSSIRRYLNSFRSLPHNQIQRSTAGRKGSKCQSNVKTLN